MEIGTQKERNVHQTEKSFSFIRKPAYTHTDTELTKLQSQSQAHDRLKATANVQRVKSFRSPICLSVSVR